MKNNILITGGAGFIGSHTVRFFVKNYNDYKIYNLDYELLTINQKQETKKLINYLGLDWEKGCLEPQNNKRGITTASSLQVRKKIYRGSSEKWKKFRPFLNGMLDDLKYD